MGYGTNIIYVRLETKVSSALKASAYAIKYLPWQIWRKKMIKNKDLDILKVLNKELKKYKVKLKFQYYDVCPFKENKIEILEVILKYSELFSSIYNKIFILSSLCDKYYKDSIPYLVKIYHSFINEVYEVPLDEMYLLHICDTMAKINALEYIDLYESIISCPMTQSAEPIIKMLAKANIEKIDNIIFNLIKKENLIPKAWLGELNEDCKYWCSLVALKCIVNKKDNKYLEFFKELINDEDMNWIKFTNSKYKDRLTINLKKQYKLLAEKGINKIK